VRRVRGCAIGGRQRPQGLCPADQFLVDATQIRTRSAPCSFNALSTFISTRVLRNASRSAVETRELFHDCLAIIRCIARNRSLNTFQPLERTRPVR